MPVSRSSDWKERMKQNNPEDYAPYQAKCRQSCRTYRLHSPEEMKARQREQSRLRMQAMRSRNSEQSIGKPRLTRTAHEEQRAKWREQKRRQQEKMTAQKRRRINEQRRQRNYEKKVASQVKIEKSVSSHQEPSEPNPSPVTTPAAKRQALARARAAMPLSPRKFVQTVTD